MKRLINLMLTCMVLVVFVSCERVAPNYAGVLMENYGKQGKEDFKVVSGKVSTWEWGTELFQVPLFDQRGEFAKPVTLKAADNTEFSATPVYSFRVVKERAVDVVFDNKQLGSDNDFIDSLEDNILEPKIYDIMKEESRRYTTDELMAKGGSLMFEQKVQKLVSEEFSKRGLELVTFSSQLEFSKSVTERIDKRNEVNTNISVIDQQIQEQRKRLELAQLQAETNRTLSEGITSQLLQQQFIEKWDGKTPLYGDTPLTIFKSN